MQRALVFLALICGSAMAAFAADPLDEVRRSFTIGGKPIPPEIFADFGDAMMSDSRPIVVTIDANAAIDSNRYADPIKTNGRWVEQMKPGSGSFNGPDVVEITSLCKISIAVVRTLTTDFCDTKNGGIPSRRRTGRCARFADPYAPLEQFRPHHFS